MSFRERIIFFLFVAVCGQARAQSVATNFKTGSLIIPMDNSKQNLIASQLAFNVKAYGLVNVLLQNNIPVNLIIQDGKAKDGIDFSVQANRISPSNTASALTNFQSGPFVIDSIWVARAMPLITAYGNSVAVYRAVNNFTALVRTQIMFKPKIAVLTNGNSHGIYTKALRLAGFIATRDFDSIPGQTLSASSCYTIGCEPHWTNGNSSVTSKVVEFLNSGGNFFTQCAGINAYEQIEHLHTTNGIDYETSNGSKTNNNIYFGTDHALMQFEGNLTNEPTGTIVNYKNNGGAYQPSTQFLVKKSPSPAFGVANGDVVLSTRKIGTAVLGGNATYLGGHDYLRGTFDLLDLGLLGLDYARATDVTWNNGLRIYYNAIFMPSSRPTSCDFVFAGEVKLNGIASDLTPCIEDTITYTLNFTNDGLGTIHDAIVKTPLTPSGLNLLSSTTNQGTYSSGTNDWTIGDLSPNQTVVLTIRYKVLSDGTYTLTAHNSNLIAGNSFADDTSALVIITNQSLPTISAPVNINTNVNSGCFATGVNLGTPSVFDECRIVSVTNNAPTNFPVGITTVVWTAVDNSGNSVSASQTVTVADNVLPLITAPNNISVLPNTGCTATGINLGNPTTSDNCGVASVTNNAPGSFPIGTTTVIWTVTDNSGNTATATQTITVVDDQFPTITPPVNVETNTNSGCEATGVDLGNPVTSDNCEVTSVTNNASASFPLGVTTVTWTVTDNYGNASTAIQTVTVNDNQNPTITAPPAISTSTTVDCSATGIDLGTPVTSDNCGVASVTNNAPASFPIGTTVVTWTVTDNSGNTATATQDVTITDNENPTITAPAAISSSTTLGCSAIGIDLGTPVTSDNCGVASVTNNAPASFPIGTTVVIWTAIDNSGNTAIATQTVTVTDNENPTITAPAAISTNTTSDCFATGINLGTPTTADNCGVASVTNNAPSSYPVGTTTVIWTVTDNSGNTAIAMQTVTITDTENPTITTPTDITVSTNSGCTATGVNLGTPTTADNCGVASVSNNAPASFELGSTIVIWTVTDNSGNTATAQQMVIVNDTELPIISNCTDTIRSCEAQVTFDLPTATDNCTLVTIAQDDGTGLTSGSIFPIGFTNLHFSATDNAGNQAGCSSVIHVIELPVSPNAGADQTVYFNEVVLNGTSDPTGIGVWTSSSSSVVIQNENDPNSAVTNLEKGLTTFFWTVSNNGCSSGTDTMNVTYLELDIPNGFSPDGDNVNDYFEIRGLENYAPATLTVNNRWGEVVYENNDYSNNWNGENNRGQALTNDTYYYHLKLNSGEDFSGFVIVKRK